MSGIHGGPSPVADAVDASGQPTILDTPPSTATTTNTELVRSRRRWPALVLAGVAAAAAVATVTGSDDDEVDDIPAPTAVSTTTPASAGPVVDESVELPERRAIVAATTDVLGQTVRLRVSPTNGRPPHLIGLDPDGLATVTPLPPASRFELDPTGLAAELDERGLLTVGPDADPVEVDVSAYAWSPDRAGELVYLTANRSDGVDLVLARFDDGALAGRHTLVADLDPSLGGIDIAHHGDLGTVLAFNTFRTLIVIGPDGTEVARLDADHVGTFGDRWLFAERTGEHFLFDPTTGEIDRDLGPWLEAGTIILRSARSPDGSTTAVHTLLAPGVDTPGAISRIHLLDAAGGPIHPALTDVRADTPLRWRLDGSVLGYTPTLADGHHRVGLFRLDDARVSVFAAPEVDLGPPVGSAPVRTDLGVIVVDRRELASVRVTDVLP